MALPVMINTFFHRKIFVSLSSLSLPLGYLFAPSFIPLWFLVFLLVFFSNFTGQRLGILEILIFVVFPVYAVLLALAFNTANSFPLLHCIAIFTPLVVYCVGKYLFSHGNYIFAVEQFAASFWILSLIVSFEFFINVLGFSSSVPQVVRASGFANFAFLQRASGFWIEPGHLGIALNFLFPFVVLSKSLATYFRCQSGGCQLVSRMFFFLSFSVALFSSIATRSSPTVLVTILEGLILFNPIIVFPLIATPFCLSYLRSMVKFYLTLSRIWIPIAFLAVLVFLSYYILTDIKILSLFSFLFQFDIGDSFDILSSGDRATRIHWVLDQIRHAPLGRGIAPYYRSGLGTSFDASTGILSTAFDSGYESSLSTPLDLSLWASPLWPILIFLYLYRRVGQASKIIIRYSPFLKNISGADPSVHSRIAVYCFVAMFSLALSMFIRFGFVGNYYYPFLFLSLSLVSRTVEFLSFLNSFSSDFLSD